MKKQLVFLCILYTACLQTVSLEEELVTAAAQGNIERVKELVERYHVPVNTKVTYNWKQPIPQKGPTEYQRSDVTPLLRATEAQQLIVIQYLLDHGADINAPMKQSNRLDISGGAQKNYTPWTDEYIYPLSLALQSKNRALSEYLINRGAQVQPQDLGIYRTVLKK